MSRLAVAQFRAQSASHRQWDGARILAYERSLSAALPPPTAVLRVPKIGLEVPVLEGTSDLTLNRAVGHISGTAQPGATGNVAIAGHRDGFFRGLKELVPGDLIDLDRATETDHYVVRDISIVNPSDTATLQPNAADTLTLVTCYPFHFVGAAPQRYVVQAARVPSRTSTLISHHSGD